MLHEALEYRRRGWSIILIRAGTKQLACRSWKPFQHRLPTEAQVYEWFGHNREYGIAVILGEVSGGLVCRDFDEMASYEEWAGHYADLAAHLPTVQTPRGRHVYFRADGDELREASPSGRTILDLGDGELRGDGAYCVLPPSRHPTGALYQWLRSPDDDVPGLDLRGSGLLPCNRESRVDREFPENGEAQRPPREPPATSPSSPGSLLHEVDLAMRRTIPSQYGQRHRMLFDLARELKAIAGLTDADPQDLKPYVQDWHQKALPHIRTKPFEESWFDFCDAWDKVRSPKGEGPIDHAFEKAKQSETPHVALQYEQPTLRLLVGLCRELQRASGEAPLFLASRTAGRLLGLHYSTASRWLRGLRRDGIVKLVLQGERAERRASRYRYLAELWLTWRSIRVEPRTPRGNLMHGFISTSCKIGTEFRNDSAC